MGLFKGSRVVINQQVARYAAGARGVVIRVDIRVFSGARYSVMLDQDGAVLEDLAESQLFELDNEVGGN